MKMRSMLRSKVETEILTGSVRKIIYLGHRGLFVESGEILVSDRSLKV